MFSDEDHFSCYSISTTKPHESVHLMLIVIALNSLSVSGLLTGELQQLQVALQANPEMVSETAIVKKWKTARTPENPCVKF